MRVETIGNATLYLGDCREILPTLGRIDAVVTDPPYGTGHYDTDERIDIVSLLGGFKQRAVMGWPEIVCKWCAEWGAPDEWITWWPTNKQIRCHGRPMRESEAIAIFGTIYEVPMRPRNRSSSCDSITLGRGLSETAAKVGDVWRDASPGMAFNSHLRLHPNEKPVSLMEKLVRLCSAQEAVIVDPFMGSGSTGEAAIKANRPFIGIEIEPEYFEVAFRRLKEFARQGDMFSVAAE